MSQYVTSGIESKLHTLGVFVDLSKAFDTIDHNILLDKLYHFGVRGNTHKWFCSYLNNRSQYTSVEGVRSNHASIGRGVPQGSILGPLLFNLYINDIVDSLKPSKLILFADDTTILLQETNFNNLILNMNLVLNKLHQWCTANRLKINYSKTSSILFGPKITTNILHYSLKINDNTIDRVDSFIFLGIFVSSNLSWLEHILFLSKKISKNLGIIYKLKFTLPFHVIKILYYTLVQPYLSYCLPLWGNACKTHIAIITLSQNNFLRLLYNFKLHDHISHLYSFSNILPINQLFKLKMLVLMHKLIIKKISPLFSQLINSFLNIPSRLLRFNPEYVFKIPRTNFLINCPIVFGLKMWNNLPLDLKDIFDNNYFKNRIHLLINVNNL